MRLAARELIWHGNSYQTRDFSTERPVRRSRLDAHNSVRLRWRATTGRQQLRWCIVGDTDHGELSVDAIAASEQSIRIVAASLPARQWSQLPVVRSN